MGLSREFGSNIERLATSGLPAPAQFERIIFSPIDKKDKELSPDEIGFLCRAMYESDMRLYDAASQTEGEGLLTRVESSYAMQHAQNTILSAVYDAMKQDKNIRVIGLLNGILPALKTVWESETSAAFRNRIEAIRVSGYSADTANPVKIDGELSPENKTASFVIVLDDIVDSGHEQAAIKYVLELLRGKKAHPDRVQMLQKAAERQFDESEGMYDEIVKEFRDAGVVIAATVYKNISFKRSLEKFISECALDDDWAKLQRAVLKGALERKQKDWVMGSTMDSDAEGVHFETILRSELEEEMDVNMEAMINIISRQKFRIGGFIEGLVAMNRSDKTDLIRAVAYNFADSLREWNRVGYKWQKMYQTEGISDSHWASDLLKQLST